MSIFSKHPEDEVLEYEEAMETPLEEIPEAQEFESIKANDKELVNTYLDEMGIIAEGTTVHGDGTSGLDSQERCGEDRQAHRDHQELDGAEEARRGQADLEGAFLRTGEGQEG